MKIRQLFQAENRSAIEDWCRKQTQQCYVGDNTALARVLGNLLMYVDTQDQSLAPHLLMNGFWEMWVTQAVVDYVKPGMTCIDVGANFGYYTLLMSELSGPTGRVFAYEPQERAHELLNKSIRINGFSGATAFQVAASNRSSHVMLYGDMNLQGSASLRPAPGLVASGEVMCERLDNNHPSNIERGQDPKYCVDFVKIDAQGHELEVLEGMAGLIKRSPKIAIVMEFTPSEHRDTASAIGAILSYGLELRTVGTDGQVRPILIEDAATVDTGDHRMLWLSKG